MNFRSARVRTADSYSSPGRPKWMEVDGEAEGIEEVLANWREAYEDPTFYPEEYYKVRAFSRKIYILRYSTLFDSWWVKDSGETVK